MSGYETEKHLRDLVNKAGITKIILVDDDFDTEAEENGIGAVAAVNVLEASRDDKQKIDKVKLLNLEQHGLFLFDINGEMKKPEALNNQVSEYWSDRIPEEKKKQFFEIFHVEDTVDLTQQAAGSLSGMIGETREVEKKGVKQWLQERKELINSHSKTGEYTLVLFDLNLKNIDTRANNINGRFDKAGYQLVKEVLDDRNCQIIPGIMTNGVKNEQDELKLSEAQFKNKIAAAAIMKTRLQEPRTMIKGLEMVVVAHALYEMCLAVQDAFKQVAGNEPWGYVELPALLKMAKTAEEEGCHASERLLRLMQSRSSDELSFKVRETCKNNSSIKLLDSFGSKWYKAFLESNGALSKIDNRSLSYKDAYISGQDLAMHRMPTYLGDIYEISGLTTGSDFYILLHQPCNISVRNDGKRKTGEQGLVLAKLIEYKKNKKDPKRISQSTISLPSPFKMENNASDLSSGQGSRFYYVDFLDYLYLPPWLLDLCVYNDEGKAITFGENGLSDGPLEYGWKLRGKEILTIIKDKSERYRELIQKDKLQEGDEIAKLLCLAVFGLSELKWDIKHDASGQYDFCIKRVARLRSNMAEGILTEFARYQSRAAYPSQLL